MEKTLDNQDFITQVKIFVKENALFLTFLGGFLAIILAFIAWKIITKPEPRTYEQILPLMQDAKKFDQQATDLSGAYKGLENQMSQAQLNALEVKPYEAAKYVQEEAMAKVDKLNEEVMKRGGITSYQDLQRVKKQPTDPVIAQNIEDSLSQNKY